MKTKTRTKRARQKKRPNDRELENGFFALFYWEAYLSVHSRAVFLKRSGSRTNTSPISGSKNDLGSGLAKKV